MLHTISWQHYFTAVTLLAAAWYTYVALRFYPPQPKVSPVTPRVASRLTAVMGSIRPDAATALHDDLVFSAPSPDDISDQTLPKGPADDLLAEAEMLISAYAGNDDKAGFISLFQVLLSKYEAVADEISLPAIIQSLDTRKLPFELQAGEWPLNFTS